MLLRIAALFTFVLAFIFSSCAPENSQIVLADFGNQKITMKDFENAYANNSGGVEVAKKDSLSKLKNFLNLYVDFRMKLRDAEIRGFDQDSSMQKELLDYKKKVGVSYLLETQLVDPAIHQLYDRRKWEIRVSHIMLKLSPDGKKLADELLDSVKNGADFASLAKKYSTDRFSAPAGGDIFYITAGMLPSEFEDAAYATEPGHVYPEVVQTKYGYHIIKVVDKRLRVPEIRASHILISFSSHGKIDSAAAKARVDTVMQKLKAGADFAALAKEYSDDPGSKQQGGDLGFFNIYTMVRPFAEAAFSLKNIGDISGIVQSQYGYHIIKLTGRKPIPTFDEDKENLKKMYKNQRYQIQYDSLADRLRKKYDYKLNKDAFDAIVANTDTTKVGEQNPKYDKIKGDVLYTFTGGSVTIGEFLDNAYKRFEYNGRQITPDFLNQAVKQISAESLIEADAMNLDKDDPKFADLMENYKDGIYIFKLQEDEVWNKIKVDSTDLSNYYGKTKDNYRWPDRVNFGEIFAGSDSAITQYYELLKQGANFDSLAAKSTERPGYKEKNGIWGLQDVNSSDLASHAFKLSNPGDFSKPFAYENGFSIVELISKDPSHVKSFDEAKAEVSGAFQEAESKQLEKDYIDRLDNLYHPKIYYNELDKAFKSN
ncbi:MAG: peptidylprolyl isomerase [Bacteroidetes bacterium]|nr:peptidylprolyl isomerase [Bacteroidota bacterium]